jgi:hypothetical protein
MNLPNPEDREIAITYLTRARFESKPQVGLTIRRPWRSFLRWLTWPTFAGDKRAAGAWCPCALEAGRVKGGRGPVSVLVADVDEASEGALDRAAEALAGYAGCIAPTFSATPETPKYRIVLRLSRALTPDEFPLVWSKMARRLAAAGIVVDKGCKNINRLYFGCVARAPEAWMGARFLDGSPLDVEVVLAVARTDETRRVPAPTRTTIAITSGSAYTRAALRRAATAVAQAPEGERHETLNREAFALARLALDERQIADALLGPFVATAGEARRREGERAIRDAVTARSAKRGAA